MVSEGRLVAGGGGGNASSGKATMMETKEGGLTARAPIFNCHPRNLSFKTSSLLENSRRTHSKQYFSARKEQTHVGKHMQANMQISIFRDEYPRIHAHTL